MLGFPTAFPRREPSQTTLIFAPFNPGLSPVATPGLKPSPNKRFVFRQIADERSLARAGVVAEIGRGAVLKRVSQRVEHVKFDPKGIAGAARPNARMISF